MAIKITKQELNLAIVFTIVTYIQLKQLLKQETIYGRTWFRPCGIGWLYFAIGWSHVCDRKLFWLKIKRHMDFF